MAKAKKDVKGQGSIVQFEEDKPKSKCRKWQLRVPTGKDPRTVKYATKAGVFHGSYTETTKALRDFIDEIEQGKIQRLGCAVLIELKHEGNCGPSWCARLPGRAGVGSDAEAQVIGSRYGQCHAQTWGSG